MRLALLSASLLLAAACAAPEPLPPRRVELTATDRSARRWSETRKLDFGTGPARSALWSGWGPDELGHGGSFVWGGGERSGLLLRILEPRGVITVVECEHLCMTMRGVRKPGSKTVTSAVRGQLRDPATRAEAMSLILG